MFKKIFLLTLVSAFSINAMQQTKQSPVKPLTTAEKAELIQFERQLAQFISTLNPQERYENTDERLYKSKPTPPLSTAELREIAQAFGMTPDEAGI